MRKNLICFFCGMFLGIFFALFLNFSVKNLENFFSAQISKPFEEIPIVNLGKKQKKRNLEIEAKAAISLRINEKKKEKEKVLFAKNENEILPIASLTKLMTALVVLQDPLNYDFSEKIKISKEASTQEDVPEYGNLKINEIKRIDELLYLMLYWSSNDAAYALAEKIGVENFVERMNGKAKEIGLENTHFSNPTGLDPESLKWGERTKNFFNFSTARDLANLGKYILKEFPIIFEFSNQKEKFELLPNQKIIALKTGYTEEAGGNLFLIFSDEEGNYYLNIILGTKNKDERFKQMRKLIDWINGKI